MVVLLDVLTDIGFLNCVFVTYNNFLILKPFLALLFCGYVTGE